MSESKQSPNRPKNKLPKNASPLVRKLRAKELFFRNYDLVSIAAICHLSEEDVLAFKTEEGWDRLEEIRKDPKNAIEAQIALNQYKTVKMCGELTIDLLARYLYQKSLAAVGGMLTNDDAKTLNSILQNIDKINRLNEGQLTDNFGVAGMTIQQARSILENDPFLDDVKVDYKRLEDSYGEEGTEAEDTGSSEKGPDKCTEEED